MVNLALRGKIGLRHRIPSESCGQFFAIGEKLVENRACWPDFGKSGLAARFWEIFANAKIYPENF